MQRKRAARRYSAFIKLAPAARPGNINSVTVPTQYDAHASHVVDSGRSNNAVSRHTSN